MSRPNKCDKDFSKRIFSPELTQMAKISEKTKSKRLRANKTTAMITISLETEKQIVIKLSIERERKKPTAMCKCLTALSIGLLYR